MDTSTCEAGMYNLGDLVTYVPGEAVAPFHPWRASSVSYHTWLCPPGVDLMRSSLIGDCVIPSNLSTREGVREGEPMDGDT